MPRATSPAIAVEEQSLRLPPTPRPATIARDEAGWDEIRRRARAFSADWADAHYETGETQSFYNDFFEIFGVKRRTVATYERRV